FVATAPATRRQRSCRGVRGGRPRLDETRRAKRRIVALVCPVPRFAPLTPGGLRLSALALVGIRRELLRQSSLCGAAKPHRRRRRPSEDEELDPSRDVELDPCDVRREIRAQAG